MKQVEDIKKIVQQIRSDIDNNLDKSVLKDKYLSKKSDLKIMVQSINNLSPEDKKEFGLIYNQALSLLNNYISTSTESKVELDSKLTPFDYSIALDKDIINSHPISALMDLVLRAGMNLGFDIFSEGPEIENDWYNFTALNIEENHPARDMWDTFYLKDKDSISDISIDKQPLLRTHTSPMQIRYMESHQPPIKALFPGRVFRNEDEDSTHLATFHQLEGLVIAKGVSLGHLKYYLKQILSIILEDKIEIRLRSSYFPFTEPSVEIDVLYANKWLEIAGAGMVSPKVLANMGLDSTIYSGFAFGFGIERIAVVKYGLSDIRHLWSLDLDSIYRKELI